ncbi:MAG: nucleotidyltransferase domain-containing protein [Magnetococcales bacterium]|nr:nucleotidyltransferase domain-containing protein [Magnetococcales bacterium]
MNKMPFTDADLAAMSVCIAEVVHAERIILFGSLARGEANEDSDIDLLVVVDKGFEQRSRWRELERIRDRIATFPMPRDILLYSREEVARWYLSTNHIIAHALQEGIPLFDRAHPQHDRPNATLR